MSMLDTIHRRLFRPDCQAVAEVLAAYLDGELDEDQAPLVERHLAECDRCGIDDEVTRAVKASLSGLHRPPDPAAVERLREFAEQLSAGG